MPRDVSSGPLTPRLRSQNALVSFPLVDPQLCAAAVSPPVYSPVLDIVGLTSRISDQPGAGVGMHTGTRAGAGAAPSCISSLVRRSHGVIKLPPRFAREPRQVYKVTHSSCKIN